MRMMHTGEGCHPVAAGRRQQQQLHLQQHLQGV